MASKVGKPIICGDFNFHLQDPFDFTAKKFLSMLHCHGWVPASEEFAPTHCLGSSPHAFFTSNNIKDKVNMGNLQVISETGTSYDHY